MIELLLRLVSCIRQRFEAFHAGVGRRAALVPRFISVAAVIDVILLDAQHAVVL